MQRAAKSLAPSAARSRSEAVAFVIMLAALIIAPLLTYPVFLMKALCFALFACAFNLLVGYVGLLSFGHALFFGWASYACAHLAKVGTISLPYLTFMPGLSLQWLVIQLPSLFQHPEFAILGATIFAAALGLIVGALAIRRQGIYFSMITLALAQMMYFFAVQAPFTHGEDGIQAVPRGKLFGLFDLAEQWTLQIRAFSSLTVSFSFPNMYITVLLIFLGCFLLIYRIINSPFGEVLKAIRENETRAISLGYKTDRYKLLAFVLSATFAGIAGATKALVFQLASLTDVDWPMSGEVILMTLVGGLGTLFGPVAGAFFIDALENYLSQFGQWVLVVQGVIFVTCVLLFRRGFIGEIARLLRVKL